MSDQGALARQCVPTPEWLQTEIIFNLFRHFQAVFLFTAIHVTWSPEDRKVPQHMSYYVGQTMATKVTHLKRTQRIDLPILYFRFSGV